MLSLNRKFPFSWIDSSGMDGWFLLSKAHSMEIIIQSWPKEQKKNKTKWKPCPGMWLLTLPIPAFQILKGNVFSCIPNTYGRATRMSYQIPALSRLFRGDRLVVTHSAVICHFYSPLSWCVRTNTSELASLQAIRKMDSAVEEYRIGYQMTWILVQGL